MAEQAFVTICFIKDELLRKYSKLCIEKRCKIVNIFDKFKKINLIMPVKYVFVKTFYSQSMHNKLHFFCKIPLPYIKQKIHHILRMAALSSVLVR